MALLSLALFYSLGVPRALTLAAIVTLSSTAVVIRVLVDRAEIDSVRGRSCLGILLMQDIAIVPLVIMVNLFAPAAEGAGIGFQLLKTGASVVGLVVVLYLLLYHLVPFLLYTEGVFADRELTVLLSISIGLGAAWAAHAVGISPALGAFIAGMLLGESPFAAQVRADIGTLRSIMVTLFFASVGMLAKPIWILNHLHWIVPAALLIFVLKTVIVFGIGRLLGLDRRHALATGITLGQIGEFSFVLAAVARGAGILEGESFDLAVSVIIALMFAAPYMVIQAFPLADRFLALLSLRTYTAGKSRPAQDATPATNRALVVGMGPAGREVAAALKEHRLEPVILDVNPRSREFARQLNLELHLGDASRDDVLIHAGIEHACIAVVTVPDPGTAVGVVETLRRLKPQIVIAARCRYNRSLTDLQNAGADIVIDEETQIGRELVKEITHQIMEDSGTLFACRIAGQASGA